jgi:hypothetical protein
VIWIRLKILKILLGPALRIDFSHNFHLIGLSIRLQNEAHVCHCKIQCGFLSMAFPTDTWFYLTLLLEAFPNEQPSPVSLSRLPVTHFIIENPWASWWPTIIEGCTCLVLPLDLCELRGKVVRRWCLKFDSQIILKHIALKITGIVSCQEILAPELFIQFLLSAIPYRQTGTDSVKQVTRTRISVFIISFWFPRSYQSYPWVYQLSKFYFR